MDTEYATYIIDTGIPMINSSPYIEATKYLKMMFLILIMLQLTSKCSKLLKKKKIYTYVKRVLNQLPLHLHHCVFSSSFEEPDLQMILCWINTWERPSNTETIQCNKVRFRV